MVHHRELDTLLIMIGQSSAASGGLPDLVPIFPQYFKLQAKYRGSPRRLTIEVEQV